MKKLVIIAFIVIVIVLTLLFSVVNVSDDEIKLAKPSFLFSEAIILEPGVHVLFPFVYRIKT